MEAKQRAVELSKSAILRVEKLVALNVPGSLRLLRKGKSELQLRERILNGEVCNIYIYIYMSYIDIDIDIDIHTLYIYIYIHTYINLLFT